MDPKKIIINTLASLSDNSYKKTRKTLIKHNRDWLVGQADLARFKDVNKHINTRDDACLKVLKKGLYDYEYFNICFLNDMLQFILDTCMGGDLPYIDIRNKNGENIWEMFFEQASVSPEAFNGEVVEITDDKTRIFPNFMDIYDKDMVRAWGSLYRKYMRFNKKTHDYIANEIREILKPEKRVLGCLVRGTDYTHLKPTGHPVQPEVDVILSDARDMLISGDYDYIYLATEDGRIDKKFRDTFGDKLLINKRNYYDEIYENNNIDLIKDVHFNRENDDYYKGVEYLSSLMILSRCDSLIAGNCGGTQAAVFINKMRYKECKVYDLGIYE